MKIMQEVLSVHSVLSSRRAPGKSDFGVFLRRCLLAACVSLAAIGAAASISSASEPTDGSDAAASPNRMPMAVFAYDFEGLEISVDASGSGDADGTIVAYHWSFGDGTSGAGVTASHAYSRPGTYTVTLTVTDEAGAMVSTDYVVAPRARNRPPTARFGHRVNGLQIAVDASGSSDPEGLVVDYDWDFGDGTTRRGVRASHAYSTAGSYTVRLTVADDPGATDSVSEVVSVSEPDASASELDSSASEPGTSAPPSRP